MKETELQPPLQCSLHIFNEGLLNLKNPDVQYSLYGISDAGMQCPSSQLQSSRQQYSLSYTLAYHV